MNPDGQRDKASSPPSEAITRTNLSQRRLRSVEQRAPVQAFWCAEDLLRALYLSSLGPTSLVPLGQRGLDTSAPHFELMSCKDLGL